MSDLRLSERQNHWSCLGPSERQWPKATRMWQQLEQRLAIIPISPPQIGLFLDAPQPLKPRASEKMRRPPDRSRLEIDGGPKLRANWGFAGGDDCASTKPALFLRQKIPPINPHLLAFISSMICVELISSIVPKPGLSTPTHSNPHFWAFSFSQTVCCHTLRATEQKNLQSPVIPFADLSLPKRSEPAIRSWIGIRKSLAIQISGMPSARHRSLSRINSRNSLLIWLLTKKLTFGVEIRNGEPPQRQLPSNVAELKNRLHRSVFPTRRTRYARGHQFLLLQRA